MLGLFVVVFSLYLAKALLAKKRPRYRARRLSIYSFCLLVFALVLQGVPIGVVSLISVLMTAYLHRAK